MADGADNVTALLIGVAVVLSYPRRWAVVSLVTAAVLNPWLGLVGAAAGWLAIRCRSLIEGRRKANAAAEDAIALAELAALGLAAGLTFPAALAAARPHLGTVVGAEVDGILRRARRSGLAQTLTEASGRAGPLYVAAARAVATGAPLAAAIERFVREARADAHAERLARARRLPVRLMLPLALLILPGFLLLAIGPAVLSAFDRITLSR